MSTPIAGALSVTPLYATPADAIVSWDDPGQTWRSLAVMTAPATITLTGDVTGSGTSSIATTVVRLQGRPLAATAPGTNQVIQWSGTQWQPGTIASGSGTVTSIAGGSGITVSPSPIVGAGTVSLTVPVSVANGGTGTSAAFTAGSVIFAGASGVYTQNNTGLFWDNANNRLGIVTNSPRGMLEVNYAPQDPTALASAVAGGVILGNVTNACLQIGTRFTPFDSYIQARNGAAGGVAYNLLLNPLGGNVGIATTTPNALLSLSKLAPTLITAGAARTDAGLLLYDGGAANWCGMAADGSGNFWLRNGISGAGNYLVMQAGGNVGIGVTGPNALLSLQHFAPANISSGAARTDATVLLYDNAAANWCGMGVDTAATFWLRTGTTASSFLVMTQGGYVGLGGVTAPSALLTFPLRATAVAGSGGRNDAAILLYDGGTANWCGLGVDANGVFWVRTGFSGVGQFMVMDPSGHVGIGTASPAAMLEVNGTFRAIGAAAPASGVGTEVIYTGGAGYVQAYDRGGAAFRPLNVSGSGITFNGATTFAVFDATSTRNVSGAWATISARELKQDVAPYQRGLAALVQLQPCVFRYRAGTQFAKSEDEPSELQIGLMADEVEPVMPELVGETSATVGKEEMPVATLTPHNALYCVINSIKELATRVEQLEKLQ